MALWRITKADTLGIEATDNRRGSAGVPGAICRKRRREAEEAGLMFPLRAARRPWYTFYDGLGFEAIRQGATFADGSLTARYAEGIARPEERDEGIRYRYLQWRY
jgi:hypothetical protein